jgi:hypothetical protein
MNFLIFALKWILGLGIAATAVVAAAYAVFQFLGKRWLEARFAERLEKFKHDQNQEIERLRYRINALMDRTTKLHQHEFEVLPEIWNKLGIAFSATSNFTSRMASYLILIKWARRNSQNSLLLANSSTGRRRNCDRTTTAIVVFRK